MILGTPRAVQRERCLEPTDFETIFRVGLGSDSGLEEHLDGCRECRTAVAQLARAAHSADGAGEPEGSLGDLHLDGTGGHVRGVLSRLSAASIVADRYAVKERVGVGAMGLVYLAHDQQLDRLVALKFRRASHARRAPDGVARMQREARAIARVSHPSVVSVYEVGEWEEHSFIVMEFVPGLTLRQWLERTPSLPRSRILGMLVEVGRGVAAIHAAGLVHRDIKPDNVLIGDDDRARITDFGLAKGFKTSDLVVASKAESAGLSPLASMTAAGALVGTPSYMAPEQHAGSPANAASDQYALCVTIYEAIYGERPFRGSTLAEIVEQAKAGPQRPSRLRSAQDIRVADALLRGLSPDPALRYPSIDKLCDSLETAARGPRYRRRWAVGALAGAVSLGALALTSGAQGEVCVASQKRLSGVWDDAARRRASEEFLARGEPGAVVAWEVIQKAADASVIRWTASYDQWCEARYEQTEPEQLLERRQFCLVQSRGVLSAALARLGSTKVEHAESVASTFSALMATDPCSDSVSLITLQEPPLKPAERAAVLSVQSALSELPLLVDVGSTQEALSRAKEAAGKAAEHAYLPIQAASLLWVGRLMDRTKGDGGQDVLSRALWAAQAGGADLTAAHAWLERGMLRAARGNYSDALFDVEHAEALLVRLGEQPSLRATIPETKATILYYLGRYSESEDLLRDVLSTKTKTLPEGSPAIARVLNLLGISVSAQGRYNEALTLLHEALRLRIATHGPRHTRVAGVLNNLGSAYTHLGRYDLARSTLDEALSIRAPGGTKDSVEVARVWVNQGALEMEEGQPADAEQLCSRALAVQEGALGLDHPEMLSTLDCLAGAQWKLGDEEAADATYRRAVSLAERRLGSDHPDLSRAVLGLGLARLSHDPRGAVSLLVRAREGLAAGAVDPRPRGRIALALSRALSASGLDPEQARTLLVEASEAFASSEADVAKDLEGVDGGPWEAEAL